MLEIERILIIKKGTYIQAIKNLFSVFLLHDYCVYKETTGRLKVKDIHLSNFLNLYFLSLHNYIQIFM